MIQSTVAGNKTNHILTILAVADLERSVKFYQEAFGWPIRVRATSYVELAFDGRGLGLYQREGYAKNTGQLPLAIPEGEIGGMEIYLHCDDLEVIIARLDRAGARRLSDLSARDWGDEVAYFSDPDGTVLAVARPLALDDDM